MERELADRFGISRTPLREAFFQLRHDRLISDGEGRGLFVSPLTLAEITGIYQVLGGLERIAVRHTERVSSKMLTRLKKAMSKRKQAGGDISGIISADLSWHQALTDYTSNREVLDLLIAPRLLAERYERAFFTLEANQQRSIAQHERIQSMVAAGNLKGAADLGSGPINRIPMAALM